MASAETAKPNCPVCHQADQVKTTEGAYNSGVTHCAPPDMPTKQVSMMSYITACIFLVGICVFCIIVFIGGASGAVGGDVIPFWAQCVLLGITIVSIISTLIVSYYAFQRVVRGDNETSKLFPAWDRAMATWKSLAYCYRDDIVFDPKANKVLSREELAKLREFGQPSGTVEVALAGN